MPVYICFCCGIMIDRKIHIGSLWSLFSCALGIAASFGIRTPATVFCFCPIKFEQISMVFIGSIWISDQLVGIFINCCRFCFKLYDTKKIKTSGNWHYPIGKATLSILILVFLWFSKRKETRDTKTPYMSNLKISFNYSVADLGGALGAIAPSPKKNFRFFPAEKA
jgi:hypothetical protein